MSHSATYGDYYITHNGDFSGDIEIAKRDVSGEAHPVAKLPYWLLEEIVAEKIKRDRISALEAVHPRDLLK